MNKKITLSTLAAGAAVPAMLMLGTGTAQAATGWAWPDSDPFGVTTHSIDRRVGLVRVHRRASRRRSQAVAGVQSPFHLDNGQESTLWFPGIPTGTTWNVTITCGHGALNNSQVLY